MENCPIVKLTNGLKVANFSSPHPFYFEDGSVLNECSAERSNALMLKEEAVETFNGKFYDVTIKYSMSDVVKDEIEKLQKNEEVDVILVPLPVMLAMKQSSMGLGKCRVCKITNRISKSVSITRFCV